MPNRGTFWSILTLFVSFWLNSLFSLPYDKKLAFIFQTPRGQTIFYLLLSKELCTTSAPPPAWARPGAPCPRGLMEPTWLVRASTASVPPRARGPGSRAAPGTRGRWSVISARAACSAPRSALRRTAQQETRAPQGTRV